MAVATEASKWRGPLQSNDGARAGATNRSPDPCAVRAIAECETEGEPGYVVPASTFHSASTLPLDLFSLSTSS